MAQLENSHFSLLETNSAQLIEVLRKIPALLKVVRDPGHDEEGFKTLFTNTEGAHLLKEATLKIALSSIRGGVKLLRPGYAS